MLILIDLVQGQPFPVLKPVTLKLGRTLALMFLLPWEADFCGEQLLHFEWELHAIKAALSMVGKTFKMVVLLNSVGCLLRVL